MFGQLKSLHLCFTEVLPRLTQQTHIYMVYSILAAKNIYMYGLSELC